MARIVGHGFNPAACAARIVLSIRRRRGGVSSRTHKESGDVRPGSFSGADVDHHHEAPEWRSDTGSADGQAGSRE
jgi:hypothetical protein